MVVGVSLDVVTGAFSYTGGYIARRSLAEGREVRTLTRRPPPPGHPLSGKISQATLQFSDEMALAKSLKGAEVLYNTYWIRFPRDGSTFEGAVENSRRLFRAAERAGLRRIVHVSVTHATDDLPYPYLRGKAEVEAVLMDSSVPGAVVRPSLIFGGREEILINNIAWLLRRMPLFAIAGDGRYQLQPVSVQDVAQLCVRLATTDERLIVDAGGPETYTFADFVTLIGEVVGSPARIVRLDPRIVLPIARVLGWLMRDVLVTRQELEEMMDEVMVSPDPPLGQVRFSAWVRDQAEWLGRRYAHELNRNWR